jgi:hypothetical protein
MVKHEPESFYIGNGAEARVVMQQLGDWLFEQGFGEDALDLGHRTYTKCKFVFGEGRYRINGKNLERLGSVWAVAVAADEIERFLSEDV